MKPKLKQKLNKPLNNLHNTDWDIEDLKVKYRQLTENPAFIELIALARERSIKSVDTTSQHQMFYTLSANDGIDSFINELFDLVEPGSINEEEEQEPTLQ
jgi:hypothetical protein